MNSHKLEWPNIDYFYELKVDETSLLLTCFMMELIPNIFIRVCIKMNFHNFIAFLSIFLVWSITAAMKTMSHAAFQTIWTVAYLRVQDTESDLFQTGAVIFFCCFPVY